jgi:hypothetical protein
MYVVDVAGNPFRSFAELFDYNYNRRPGDPWKNYVVPVQTQGYSYNKAAYVLLVLARDLALPNAQANLDWVYNLTENGGTTQNDLAVEAQYAIAPADVADPAGKPRAPLNVRRTK